MCLWFTGHKAKILPQFLDSRTDRKVRNKKTKSRFRKDRGYPNCSTRAFPKTSWIGPKMPQSLSRDIAPPSLSFRWARAGCAPVTPKRRGLRMRELVLQKHRDFRSGVQWKAFWIHPRFHPWTRIVNAEWNSAVRSSGPFFSLSPFTFLQLLRKD